MSGFDRLYEVIYGARPAESVPFFLGRVTREAPVEISAFGLPLPRFRMVRGLPEICAGDEVVGIFVNQEALILGVL